MKKEEHWEFFNRYGDYGVTLNCFEVTQWISVEDLYRHFKARMIAELKVHGGTNQGVVWGELKDTP